MELPPGVLTRLSIYKGMAVVAVTAVLLTSLLPAESRARNLTMAARRQAQEKLEQNERRLRHLFSVSPSIIYTLNPNDHSITWVSKNVTSLLGYAPDELLQPGLWEAIVHPEDIPAVRVNSPGRRAHLSGSLFPAGNFRQFCRTNFAPGWPGR